MLSGDVMVSGHGFVYEGQINTPEINETNVQIRIGLYQNRILKQLSSIKDMKVARHKFNSFVLPFMVKVPGGDYDLRVLIKFPEEDTWKVIMSEDMGINVTYQRFTVYDRAKAPFCKYFACDWELPGDVTNNLLSVYLLTGEVFHMTARLSNPTGNVMRGKIKVVYERNYKRFLRKENHSIESESQDMCIDASAPMDVVLAPREMKSILIPGMFEEFVEVGNTWTPNLYLYFKMEGDNQWDLVPPDASGYFTEDFHWSTTSLGINNRAIQLCQSELSEEDCLQDIRITFVPDPNRLGEGNEYPDGYLEISGVDADIYVSLSSKLSDPRIDPTDHNGEQGGKAIKFNTFWCNKTKGGVFLTFRGKINRNIRVHLK